VPPAEAIKSRSGAFDATLDELDWQLGLFKDAAAERA